MNDSPTPILYRKEQFSDAAKANTLEPQANACQNNVEGAIGLRRHHSTDKQTSRRYRWARAAARQTAE